MICCNDKVETTLFILAAARSGLIFSVLDNSLPPREAKLIKEDFEPSIVILDQSTLVLKGIFRDCTVVHSNQINKNDDNFLNRPFAFFDMRVGNSQDIACIIYTTGSTASPKGICITHSNILFLVKSIQSRLSYREDDIIGHYLPLSFDYGLYQIFLAVNSGASLFFGSPKNVSFKLLLEMNKHKISILPCVPSLISILLVQLKRKFIILKHLRTITSTGDVLSINTVETIQDMLPGVRVYPMYGLTECKRVSILRPDEWKMHKGSVGRPLPGTRVLIRDNHGRALTKDCMGELVVQGPHIALGYFNDKNLTQRKFVKRDNETELLTGDICRIDHEGYIYFICRKGRQIKHCGYRIEPSEIENAILEMPGTTEAALTQTKNPDILHLFVSVDTKIGEEKIRSWLKPLLPSFKFPGQIHILENLPKNRNGKPDYFQLKQMLE